MNKLGLPTGQVCVPEVPLQSISQSFSKLGCTSTLELWFYAVTSAKLRYHQSDVFLLLVCISVTDKEFIPELMRREYR